MTTLVQIEINFEYDETADEQAIQHHLAHSLAGLLVQMAENIEINVCETRMHLLTQIARNMVEDDHIHCLMGEILRLGAIAKGAAQTDEPSRKPSKRHLH